jgi:amino acid adenylation domain-containing protein
MPTAPTITRLRRSTVDDPDAPCVEDGAGLVTRAELLSDVDAIAAALCGRGVRGGLVAVLLDRDRGLPAALFGIHAAGSAYLPLDPALPDHRLAAILDRAGVTGVVTARRYLDRLPTAVPALVLDDLSWRGEPAGDRSAAGVAYVIFTSGSTGVPKGVTVGTASLAEHFAAVDHELGPADGQIWHSASSVGYDSHVTDMMWSLSGGARVCIGPNDVLSMMTGCLSRGTADGRSVTHMQCTPSLLRLLAGDPAALRGLRAMRALLIGGEPFPADLVATLTAGDEPPVLYDAYGPTEATVWVACCRVEPDDPAPGGIRYWMDRASLRVLDGGLAEVPPGGIGNLYIGGAPLALGYHRDPELTARRFVPDPWSAGGRLYDTGDVATRRPDGTIVVIGRADNQIKIRGNRVELDEVESVLRRYPGVVDAVVVPDARPAARTLAALVVGDGVLDGGELSGWLRSVLPGYMVPTSVQVWDRLPLNPSGKVDRDATYRALHGADRNSRRRVPHGE